MRKYLVILLMLTACQQAGNHASQLPVSEHTPIAITQSPTKKPVCMQQNNCTTAITLKVNKALNPGLPAKQDCVIIGKSVAELTQLPAILEEPELIREDSMQTRSRGGSGSDMEGYIPFIKQYW